MATKKVKWYQKDGTLLHPETEVSMLVGKLAKSQLNDVLSVGSLGPTSVPTYTVFASQSISAQGNTNSSYLVVGGGNFGGYYNGAWIVECSGRGTGANMRVTELVHNSSGTITFGHYVSSGKAYFGMTRSSYGSGIDIYYLNGALGELKLFQNNTTAPTGWTAVSIGKFSEDIDTSKFVTTNTEQTIEGAKYFTKALSVKHSGDNLITQYGANGIDIGTNVNPTAVSLSFPTDKGGTLATTSYVDTKVANIVNSAPETLDTLNELATALGNDPNFATTVATQIGGKVSKAGDTMTGTLVIPNLDNIKISAASATKNASPTLVATFKNNSAQDGLAASTVEQVLPQRLREYQGSGTGNHAVDDLYQTGFYYIDKDNTKNRPPFYQGTLTGNDYKVLVTGYSNQWAQQIATDFRSNDVFLRRLQSGGWQGWTALVKMQQGLVSGALRPPTGTVAVFDGNVNATIKSSDVLISDIAKKTDITWSNIPDKPTIVSSENFVTLDTQQNITGAKTFNGITIGDKSVVYHTRLHYNQELFEIECVEEGDVTVLTIPKGKTGTIAVDEDIAWWHLAGKPSWITDTKPTYSWSEITNRPTIPDVSKYVAKSGDTMTGDLKVGSATIQTNGYITGTWLQTTSPSTHLSSTATKVAVIDASGWIYHRTPSELLSDMGGATTSYVDTKFANSSVEGCAKLNAKNVFMQENTFKYSPSGYPAEYDWEQININGSYVEALSNATGGNYGAQYAARGIFYGTKSNPNSDHVYFPRGKSGTIALKEETPSFDTIFPVGSLWFYWFYSGEYDTPAYKFGGSWELLPAEMSLLTYTQQLSESDNGSLSSRRVQKTISAGNYGAYHVYVWRRIA